MSFEALPHEDLRRKLAEIGIPPERHAMRELVKLLPGAMPRRPYDEASADAVAEVLIYLAEKNVLTLPLRGAAAPDPAWGERLCQSYRTAQDLLGLAVPFLAQGLQANERCIWIADEALAAQAGAVLGEPGGRIEIIDFADAELWQREENRSVAQGYNGLRICADARYEAQMDASIPGRRIKALCTHVAGARKG